jgi:hypothetical protein
VGLDDKERERGLELIAQKSFAANDELVKVVDFLNRTLRDRKILFGINLQKAENEMTISIYQV